MKNVDYIIVGDGYAALFFAHQLIRSKKSFVVFSQDGGGASHVSAGIINPVVLKKFTTFWKASEQIAFLRSTFSEIEEYLPHRYLVNEPIHRIFHDEKERELWSKKTKTPELSHFLADEFTELEMVQNLFMTGRVLNSSRFNVSAFFTDFFEYLRAKDKIILERFDANKLQVHNNRYGDLSYEHIVFCEGAMALENPFFSDLPIQPNKGHHLKVKLSKPLNSKVTIKKKHFLFPIDNGLYYYGGTYDREQTHREIDQLAVDQLKAGLQEIYPYPFEVEDIKFGFRPTVKDRRPILGAHSEFSNMFIFNGLGARGILNGCYFSKVLFEHIENKAELPPEVDIKRFET